MTVVAQSFAVESPDFGKSGIGVADLIVAKCLVTAVAVGFVVTVLTLAQIIILALAALECLRSEITALV